MDVASGRFALDDQALGRESFDTVLEILERALGPGGVMLGTLVRLPVTPPDSRPWLRRNLPRIRVALVALGFVGFGALASGLVVRILAGLAALLTVLFLRTVEGWVQPPVADLVLGLDGLVVPLPPDLRRTVKLPFSVLRRGAIESAGETPVALVIEHERGSLQYPLAWLDPRMAREFAKQVASRAGS
jgi:hypothetical protein